jgi:hypothetical protein
MYTSDETLLKVFDASQDDEYVQKLLREWNEETDWGQKDMLMSKLVNYVDSLSNMPSNLP